MSNQTPSLRLNIKELLDKYYIVFYYYINYKKD